MVKEIDRFWGSFNNAEEQAVVNVPCRERGRPDAPLVGFMWDGCRELPLGTTIPSLPSFMKHHQSRPKTLPDVVLYAPFPSDQIKKTSLIQLSL